MKQAVRIEYSDGLGLFGSYILDEDGNATGERRSELTVRVFLEEVSDRHEQFNEPYEDGIIDFTPGKDYCAYKSLEELNKWIYPEEMKKIIEFGYRAYLLELTKCKEGRDQIAYRKEDIITKTDTSNLFL